MMIGAEGYLVRQVAMEQLPVSKRYREAAERCRFNANATADSQMQRQWLELAQQYDHLADDEEGRHRWYQRGPAGNGLGSKSKG